mgnify:CR=1 FL=1
MYCYSLQNRVVFLQLKSFSCILSVFSCDIARCSRHSTLFVFCTFQNHLYSVTFCFLCHCKFSPLRLADYFNAFPITITFSHSFSQRSIQSFFVNNTQPVSANAKADPTILFYIVELFVKQVQIKGSLSSSLWVWNIVANHGFLSGNLTNLRHCYLIFIVFFNTYFKRSAK